MSRRGSGFQHPWVWPVLLVTALHLLSTSGTWWVTDHGEILAVANRFLTTGHLDLNNLGPGFEDWTRIAAARNSTSTRFLPLSILILTPFLVLDHLAGWRDPSSFRFVYLQGHVFVGLGLVLVARSIARTTRHAGSTALSVLVVGLNWPVWMIARRMGPEPILFALMAIFVTSGTRWRIVALLLLPWVHATGPLLGLCALLWLWLEPRADGAASMAGPALAWAFGVASVMLLWNLPRHGHAILGGYGRFVGRGDFELGSPLSGLLVLLPPFLAWTLPLWSLVVREGRRAWVQSFALWLPAFGFFALFSHPDLLASAEPERRLAPLLAALIVTCAPRKSPLRPPWAVGLVLLSLASGVVGLSRDFVAVVPTPAGIYSGPFLLFLRLAFVEARPVLSASFVLLLLIVIVWTGGRTLRQIVAGDELPQAQR